MALREALDRIWEAVAIVGPTGNLVYANSAALEILRRGGGIAITIDLQIFPRCVLGRERLLLAIREHEEASLSIMRQGHAPLILRVRPVPDELRQTLGAEAYLFFSDPEERLVDCTDVLRSAYGLTYSEARLMQLLGEGASLKKIASRQRMTYETVRTYVRRILGKTGAKRQSELVRLMLALR